MLQIALYKGPATGLWNRVFHWVTCRVTRSKYSHVELVVNGTCCSSSSRDGGVRVKGIDLHSGKWDVFEISGDEGAVWKWFTDHAEDSYDYAGLFRHLIPFLPHGENQWTCSEACAAALGIGNPEDFSPQTFVGFYGLKA